MYVHQYVQHDWSPLAWALMLTGLAVAVFGVMALFLLMATRSYGASAPPPAAGTTEPQATESAAPVAPQARIVGHP